jgi:hypothetical protein
MSRITTDIVKSLRKSLQASDRKTSAYDTQATIRRIEDGVAWVHIPGGVDETPVQLTINAKEGDQVQVRVSGGRAFLVGNATAPPTDNAYARQVNRTLTNEISNTNTVVKGVQKVVQAVKKIADNTNQYFWHTEEGEDTGTHITEKPQEEFLADPENGGGNFLARSNGIAVRDGLTELSTFSAEEIRLGKANEPHASIKAERTEFTGEDGAVIIKNNANGVRTFDEGGWRLYEGDIEYTLQHTPIPGSFVVYKSGAAGMKHIVDDPSRYISYSGTGKTITVHTGTAPSDLPPVSTTKIYVIYDTEEFKTTSVGIGRFENGDFGSGRNAFAAGDNTKAYGENSAAFGRGTIARGELQTVLGQYNEEDRDSLLIIGDGSDDSNRRNIFKVGRNGNVWSESGLFNGIDLVPYTIDSVTPIITAGSDVTITGAKLAVWGMIAMLEVDWKNNNAITVPAYGNISPNVLVGTIESRYRPVSFTALHSHGDDAGAAWYTLRADGVLALGAMEGYGSASRTIAAGSTFKAFGTYILAN